MGVGVPCFVWGTLLKNIQKKILRVSSKKMVGVHVLRSNIALNKCYTTLFGAYAPFKHVIHGWVGWGWVVVGGTLL